MGYDAPCTLRYEGRTTTGTALLESTTLVVRGPVRLSVPLARVTEVTADGGWLRVRFDDRTAELALGDDAGRWAKRIANPRSRADKLGIKAGLRVLAIGAMEEAFIGEIAAAGATLERWTDAAQAGNVTPFDLVFHALDRPEALDALATLVAAIVPAGAIWTLRTKGRGVVTEAETRAAGQKAGLVDVKVVSFSATVTAEKFVIPVARRPGTGVAATALGRRTR